MYPFIPDIVLAIYWCVTDKQVRGPRAITRRTRVLVADDHPSIRENVRYLLNAEPDLEVVGVARDGASAIRAARELRPDVVVVDYDLPDTDGLTVARALRREEWKPGIVLYTLDPSVWVSAGGTDATVCVAKDEPPEALVNSVRVLGRSRSRSASAILLVEDDPEIRQVMRAALEDSGRVVVEAADGYEALAHCQRHEPAIVVLDLGLPRMSGREFVAAYRQLPGPRAPIVVVSAIPNASQVARDLGASEFLPKPFSIDELSKAVVRAIG